MLAVGVTRGWRRRWGCRRGVAGLVLVVARPRPGVDASPIDALRLVIGGVLLIFGLQWLRKAILRASG